MRDLRRVASTCIVVLGLAAAGCGGDTAEKNDYVDAVNKAQTDFNETVGKVQTGATSGAADAEKNFDALGASLDKVVADLKAVDAPDDVKAEHDQLVANMAEFGDVIEKFGEQVSSGDQQKILDAQTELITDAGEIATKISQTITQINTKLQE